MTDRLAQFSTPRDFSRLNVVDEMLPRVPASELRAFVTSAAESVGLGKSRSQQLARLLVASDLRGVFTHGSVRIAGYARAIREGALAPNAPVSRVAEGPAFVHLDGCGGLGYFAGSRAMKTVAAKAKVVGVAVGVTRNHGHFGAAGHYTRMAIADGLVGFATAGRVPDLRDGGPQLAAAGAAGMSWAVPNGAGAPLVLDAGVINGLWDLSPAATEVLLGEMRSTLLRSFGLGTITVALGAFLADSSFGDPPPRYPDATDGGFYLAFSPELFVDRVRLERSLQDYSRAVADLVGFGTAPPALPGEIEWGRSRRWLKSGVPLSDRHRRELVGIADELSIDLPPFLAEHPG